MRSVLLARADRYDDDGRTVDLRPAHVTQVHVVTVPKDAAAGATAESDGGERSSHTSPGALRGSSVAPGRDLG